MRATRWCAAVLVRAPKLSELDARHHPPEHRQWLLGGLLGRLRHLRALVPVVLGAVLALSGAVVTPAAAIAESNGGVRVMPLGDSITHGTQVPGGYRIGLWQSLVNARYRVDFVGTQFNGPGNLGDHDHEGRPGWRI